MLYNMLNRCGHPCGGPSTARPTQGCGHGPPGHGYVCPVPRPEAGRRIYGRSQTAAQDPLSRSAIIMMSFTGPGSESGEAAPTSRGPAAPPRPHAPPLEVRRKGPGAPEAGGLRPAGRQKTRTQTVTAAARASDSEADGLGPGSESGREGPGVTVQQGVNGGAAAAGRKQRRPSKSDR